MNEEITHKATGDYYEIWFTLTALNNKISDALKLISGQEKQDEQVDKKLREILEPNTDVLSDIVDDLSFLLN